MKKNLIRMLLLSACVASSSFLYPQDRNNEEEVVKLDSRAGYSSYRQGEVVVKFTPRTTVRVSKHANRVKSAGVSSIDKVLAGYGVANMERVFPNATPIRTHRKTKSFSGEMIEEADISNVYKIELAEENASDVMQMVEQLNKLSEVEFAEPNYLMYSLGTPATTTTSLKETTTQGDVICFDPTTNPFFEKQYNISAIGVDKLWKKAVINSTRPIIGIIDTGVDITHPDLADNIWTNPREANGESGYDDDNNGYIDDLHGWDFVNNTGDINDFNSHGTHCAGIAAAAHNGKGIVGANPRALIMPVAVMQSNGSGDITTICKGIEYAVDNGATVLSMSFGSYYNSMLLRQTLGRAYQKAVLVAAAGNDCLGLEQRCIHGLPAPMYPGAYSFVLGVQATNALGAKASFSNFDGNGSTFAMNADGLNYELSAPGSAIWSTIPGGNYRAYNGTSMATPLVAGAISALKMVKEYDSQEILWGDLIHSNNGKTVIDLIGNSIPANVDMSAAFDITDADRRPMLDLVTVEFDDKIDGGNGDGMVDAGERVAIYPTIRNTFGVAKNIKMNIAFGEFEDESLFTIETKDVDFGNTLSTYGQAKSANPIIIKLRDDIADGRIVKVVITATCDNAASDISQEMTISVNNCVKLGGVIAQDMTLTADKNYRVVNNLGIPEGVTLTIEPGTVLNFDTGTGISCDGDLVANGEPGKMITFTGTNGSSWNGITRSFQRETITISYARILYAESQWQQSSNYKFSNCIIDLIDTYNTISSWISSSSNIINGKHSLGYNTSGAFKSEYCNIVNNIIIDTNYNHINDYFEYILTTRMLSNCNSFNNSFFNNLYSIGYYSASPTIVSNENVYLGTSNKDIAKKRVLDIDNPISSSWTFGKIDLTNMPTKPYAEAHGIVWKVVVNGFDAQDEYDQLAPLGVGKHKFEVYFNRPMNKDKAPNITFGVRSPYTQVAVAEDGAWNEDGTIYTAYCNITGKTASDGECTIYVYGAEDNEYFEIPEENTRFHVNVQAAGSLSTGFMGEGGLGRVNLSWENAENNFEDFLGYNLYRYSIDDNGVSSDTIRINRNVLDAETLEFTDYDVTPGTTYNYYYNVITTDLKETDKSNVVAVTPLTSMLGDANGSGAVDVADVVTVVNYSVGESPKPFIHEAADVNTDNAIDILDVVGIIKLIVNPNAQAATGIESVAEYTIENGTLYVNSPVDLAGVQVSLELANNATPTIDSELAQFETVSSRIGDNGYIFLAYSMSGATLTAGKHALMHIGDNKVAAMTLANRNGGNVLAVQGHLTGVQSPEANRIEMPYPNPFKSSIEIPYVVSQSEPAKVEITINDISGRLVHRYTTETGDAGRYSYIWTPMNMESGMYFITLRVNGVDCHTSKVIYDK